MIKNILWDFDNTLAHRNGMWTSTIKSLIDEYGYSQITNENIDLYMRSGFPWHHYEISHKNLFAGKSWWEFIENKIYRDLLKLAIEPNVADKIKSSLREKYLDIKFWNLYSETTTVLEKLTNSGFQNYILSNHIPELKDLINSLNIDKYFIDIFSSANIGYEKPNYKIFQYALTKLKSDPTEVVMVGDNYISDIIGARSNGISGILVRTINKTNYPYYSLDLTGLSNEIEKINTFRSANCN